MYSNPFPELRSAYLRAVARAWRDDDFKRQLFRQSEEQKYGALPLLNKEFGLHFPWNVKLKIIAGKPGPVWQPVGTSGWIGTEDAFTLYLPVEDKPPENPAELLARYYQERPCLLGRTTSNTVGDNVPSSFAEFGAMTLRALALTWENKEFRARLFARDEAGNAADVKQVFQDYLDYQVPWNFSLHFQRCEYPQNDAAWAAFPLNEITLVLPQKPASNDCVVEAVALAAYNGTGPQYPFTCG